MFEGRKACGYPGTPQLGAVYPLKFIYEVGEQVQLLELERSCFRIAFVSPSVN